nr:hypothetical protein BaRGS_001939 [Batillaria attramentaria]
MILDHAANDTAAIEDKLRELKNSTTHSYGEKKKKEKTRKKKKQKKKYSDARLGLPEDLLPEAHYQKVRLL